MLASVLAVSLTGPAQVEARLESLTDGSVRVWYTPKVSGKYMLRVGVRSKANTRIDSLPGSPFVVDVAPRQSTLRRDGRQRYGAGSPAAADRSPRQSPGGGCSTPGAFTRTS